MGRDTQRRARHGRHGRQRGHRDGHRARRPVPARRDRERLRQAHARRRLPQDEPRRQGRQDDPADRGQGRARRRRSSCATTTSCVFISQNGMVQRIAVRELRPLGRNAQGFRLMNVREDDLVSAVALVDGVRDARGRAGRGGRSAARRDRRRRRARRSTATASSSPTRTTTSCSTCPRSTSDDMPDSDIEDVAAPLNRRGPRSTPGPSGTSCWTTWPSAAGLKRPGGRTPALATTVPRCGFR